jgi:DNA transformation protein
VAKRGDDSFTTFVLDQLRGLGQVEARSMFGGKGLYWRDQIFGLIDEGQVFFRVAAATVGRYAAKGAKPFEPWPGHVMKGYYEVPTDVLEDAEQVVAWAREAWELPRTKSKQKRQAKPPRASRAPGARSPRRS